MPVNFVSTETQPTKSAGSTSYAAIVNEFRLTFDTPLEDWENCFQAFPDDFGVEDVDTIIINYPRS